MTHEPNNQLELQNFAENICYFVLDLLLKLISDYFIGSDIFYVKR